MLYIGTHLTRSVVWGVLFPNDIPAANLRCVVHRHLLVVAIAFMLGGEDKEAVAIRPRVS
jgi:hypothetical protein